MAKTRLTVLTVQTSGNPMVLLLPRVTSVRALKCDVDKSTCNVGPRERMHGTRIIKTPIMSALPVGGALTAEDYARGAKPPLG